MTVSVAGQRLEATAIDTVTTPTGTWPVSDLGAISGGRVYQFGLSSRPSWWSVCIVRYPVAGDRTVGERIYPVSVSGVDVKVSVLGGSMKCVDNGEPIAPSMARLREAVADKRVLPYSTAAFSGWPVTPKLAADRNEHNLLGYQASRIYGRSASNNSIANPIVGSGGEASTSRGFIAGDDAILIASALAGNSTVFNETATQNRIQVLYGLSLPYLAIWSESGDRLRDPQHPFTGDRPYLNEGSKSTADDYGNEGEWTAPADYAYLGALDAVAGTTYGHTRDEAHLFNNGYAYWLATGDPRAALLQQSIAAYALASVYQGGYSDGRYRTRFTYQRTTMNMWSAMWKLKDVADNVSTANGKIFWSKARAQKMVDDVLADWKAQLAKLDAASDVQSKSSSIFRGIDLNGDNAYNSFMIQVYGPEAAYLFASKGKPEMLEAYRRELRAAVRQDWRHTGLYGHGSGSGFKVLEDGVMPYSDEASFVAWVNTAESPIQATASMSAPHALRDARLLVTKLAQDACGVAGWRRLPVLMRRFQGSRRRAPRRRSGRIPALSAGSTQA